MKRIIILTGIIFLTFSQYSAKAFSDPATTAAILQQTAVQTAEHLKQLAQAIQQVQYLQSQLSNTQNLLRLAQESATGIDGLQISSDFHNAILSANAVIRSVQSSIDTTQNLPEQWKQLFGSLDSWGANEKDLFGNIDMSDKTNTSGYLIGDSYQRLYEQNAATVAQFTSNARQVSEKGALKQIAEEIAQLIQMENNSIYLLSQILKGQSIEASNDNLKRKQDAVQFEQENQGVQAFMNMVDGNTFGI